MTMKLVFDGIVFEGSPQDVTESVRLYKSIIVQNQETPPIEAPKPVKAPKATLSNAKPRARGIGAIRTKNKFYSRLRFERAKHGWSVNHMGSILGCSKSTYSLLENSKAPANIVQYTTLSETLGVPTDQLFNPHGFALGFTPTRVIE